MMARGRRLRGLSRFHGLWYRFWPRVFRPFLKYTSLSPFPLFSLVWHALRVAYRTLPQRSVLRRIAMSSWKSFNSSLNELEMRARRERLISLPVHLILDTTMRCNLLCPHCYRSHAEGGAEAVNQLPDMREQLFRSIAQDLFPTAETINFGIGAEPLMTGRLEPILDAAERYKLKVDLITNGTLLGKRGLLPRLVPLLARVEVSIDSLDPEQFEELRYPAEYGVVMSNLREIARRRLQLPPPRFQLGVSFVAMRRNARELPKVVRLVSELSGTHVRVTPLLVFDRTDAGESLVNFPALYNEILEEARIAANETGVALHAPGPFALGETAEVPPTEPCAEIYRSTFISFEGLVRTCCQFNPPTVGDLREQDFRSTWNGTLMRRIRRTYGTAQAIGTCKDCFIVRRGPGTAQTRLRQEFMCLRESRPGDGASTDDAAESS